MLLDTPFGKASSKKVMKRNMTKYIVDKKEYIYVAPIVNDTIPEEFRTESGWYFNGSAKILHLIYPELFPPKEVTCSCNYYMNKHPEIYEYLKSTEFTQLIVMPTKFASTEAHRRRWYEQNKRNFVEIQSWGDSDNEVDPGFVLVEAAIGGDANNYRSYFMVPEQEYRLDNSSYGFVCNPEIHEQRELDDEGSND